jgi:hypothetical protein
VKESKQAQIDRLTEALAFYADPATHQARREDDVPVWPIYDDQGKRARQALGLPEPPTIAEQVAAEMAEAQEEITV